MYTKPFAELLSHKDVHQVVSIRIIYELTYNKVR